MASVEIHSYAATNPMLPGHYDVRAASDNAVDAEQAVMDAVSDLCDKLADLHLVDLGGLTERCSRDGRRWFGQHVYFVHRNSKWADEASGWE